MARPYTHVHGWCVGMKVMGSPAPLALWGEVGSHFDLQKRVFWGFLGCPKGLKKAKNGLKRGKMG